MAEHVVSQRPGAQVSSDFATFPCSSFVKVKLRSDYYKAAKKKTQKNKVSAID